MHFQGNATYTTEVLYFRQVRRGRNPGSDDWDVLHFESDTSFAESRIMKAFLFGLCAFAETAYICQYSILKAAS